MNMKTFSFLFLLLTMHHLCIAQVDSTGKKWEESAHTIFNDIFTLPDETPEVLILTDLKQLIKGKYEEAYQPALIAWHQADTASGVWSVKLRARGNRRKDVCYLPPIKLNFDQDTLAFLDYQPFDKIKVVTQCRASSGYADYLLKEYLAYRLYNILTPASFRVRLVKLTMKDVNDGNTEEMYSIFLEPEEELDARLNAEPVELSTTYFVHLESKEADRLALFQYMIGNTDWNVNNLHNLITIKVPETRKLTPIPYDFDYSGLVGTNYAVPHESLPIHRVQERYHKGQSIDKAELDALIEEFSALVPQFLSAIEEIERYDARCANEARRYLKPFFDMLEKPKSLYQEFQRGG